MTNLQENINLLNDILERNFYFDFKQKNNEKKIIIQFFQNNNYDDSTIIPNYQKKSNTNNILNNFVYFLKWYKNNNFLCDILIDDQYWLNDNIFREKIFNLLYFHFKKNQNQINIYITNELKDFKKEDFIYLEKQILLFKKININLIFTVESNGKYIDNYSDDYYELLFDFIEKYNFLIKSKIIPTKIKNYKKNYLWFQKKLNNKKLLFLYEEETENWTENNIQEYLSFINFYIDNFQGDIYQELFNKNNFSFLNISDKGILEETNPYGKCKFYKNLNILIEDLSIILCKKFHYDDLKIGHFLTENNQIKEVIPNNLPVILIPCHTKRYTSPKCECCHFIGFCNGYCHGEAYKIILNPLIPIMETCKMKKAKYAFIFYKLSNIKNIINNYNLTESHKNYILKLIEDINKNIIN